MVAALNGFDVQGRKLRVEYKKVLQAGEKERIEREKAIRRMRSMQLEKEQQQQTVSSMPPYDDFGPVMPPTFPPQRSFSAQYVSQQQQYSPPQLAAISGLSPPFLNTNVQQLQSLISPLAASPGVKSPSNELDLNDPSTLDIYSRILLFKDDHMRDELAFSRTLSPKQRRVVHLIAQKLGVYHYSVGEGDERYAVVTRIDPATVSPFVRAPWTVHGINNCPSVATATSPYAFPRPFSIPYADWYYTPNQPTAGEEVHARHEIAAESRSATEHSFIQRKHPRRLRHYRLPFPSLSRWIRIPLQ